MQRIIAFYAAQPTDISAYFEAAWRYRYRAELGKPPAGRLHMRAFHESGQVVIEITDDGGGIDVTAREAVQLPVNDPTVMISAMAAVT